jgi:hypothetical protein
MKKKWLEYLPGVPVAVGFIALIEATKRYGASNPELARWMFPGVMFALLIPISIYYFPRYRRSMKLLDEGNALLQEGRIALALEKFEASRPLARRQIISTFNIGIARLLLWQLPQTEQEFTGLLERKDLKPQFRALLTSTLAVVAALDGRVKVARERMADAQSLWREVAPAQIALASAVIACREGRWADARALLGTEKLNEIPPGPLRALRAALEAWCQEQLTGERQRVDAIALFGEASQDSLQAAWPEFVAFVVARAH